LPAKSLPPRKRPPTTSAELVAQSRGKNRLLALAVVAFMVAVFIMVFVVTKINRLNDGTHSPASQAHIAAHTAAR